MNLVKKLNELQDIDLEIRKSQEEIERIKTSLSSNGNLLQIKNDYATLTSRLLELNKNKQEIEWDIDELNKNIVQIMSRLYGGKINNPKELLSLEQDLQALKKRLNSKEDLLLEFMENEESSKNQLNKTSVQLEEAEAQWKIDTEKMVNQKNDLEVKLDKLRNERGLVISEIGTDVLQVYERLFLKNGCAVVRVEQGRCHGCRIALPMNDLQRARSGNVVQCSSCGMILYI